LSDGEQQLCQAFEVLKEKKMFGNSYQGIERSTFVFDKQGILRQLWRDVSVFGHVDDVLKCLQTL
jgi:peroxiredoxin Q/BCP